MPSQAAMNLLLLWTYVSRSHYWYHRSFFGYHLNVVGRSVDTYDNDSVCNVAVKSSPQHFIHKYIKETTVNKFTEQLSIFRTPLIHPFHGRKREDVTL
jgi:hypothetical protein